MQADSYRTSAQPLRHWAVISLLCLIPGSSNSLAASIDDKTVMEEGTGKLSTIRPPAIGSLRWPTQQTCGVVAAFQALRAYGRNPSLVLVANELHVGPEGSSMLDIRDYLQDAGLAADPRRCSAKELYEFLERRPDSCAIALLKPDHWVFVYRSNNGGLEYYSHPNWRNKSVDGFQDVFQGSVVLITPAQSWASPERWILLATWGSALASCVLGLSLLAGPRRRGLDAATKGCV